MVQKYTEQDGQIRFEKYGGWVAIPSYEVLRIVPDDSDDSAGTLPTPVPTESPGAPLYVATRSGATVRATNVGPAGADVRVSTPEGSLTFHRADLVGVLRVPAAPASPEAWITLWGGDDGSGGEGLGPGPGREPRPQAPPPTLSDRPHLLQLASGVVIQVDGFWLEAGEIRFRRLGGIVGFALGEIARLLPQEAEPVRGRLAVRFVRRLGADRMEVLGGPEDPARPADRHRAGIAGVRRPRARGPRRRSTVGCWSTSSSIASDPGRTGTRWPMCTCRTAGC